MVTLGHLHNVQFPLGTPFLRNTPQKLRYSLDIAQVLGRARGLLEIVVRLKTHPEFFRSPEEARQS